MKVSVIVPFKNSASTFPLCLEALADQAYESAEFIFVENNSTDESSAVLNKFLKNHKEFNARHIVETKNGASSARNRGAREAAGEWLVFTDSDCVPDRRWLSDLMSEPIDDKTGGLAGSVNAMPTDNIIGKFLGLYTLPANRERKVFKKYEIVHGGFPTADLAVKKEVFDKIGGFDESILIYGEDHDLCDRLYKAGYEIIALTNSKIFHIHREDLPGMIKQAYGFGEAHAKTLYGMDKGFVIIDTPVGRLVRQGQGGRLWVDLNQADKKMFLAVVAGLVWCPLGILPLVYLLFLSIKVAVKARALDTAVSFYEPVVMAVLLLIKSAAMTCGRIRGSFRKGVICI
jgi:GT2 family glycosyltransferase